MIARALDRWVNDLALVGLETGSLTPWLARRLRGTELPVTGWFAAVFVKSGESHRLKALLTPRRYQSGERDIAGAKKARVAVARKLACLLLRLWKDGTHYDEGFWQTA